MEENRSFGFWVSDWRDLERDRDEEVEFAIEGRKGLGRDKREGEKVVWKARFVDGEDLGPEWDGALERFWRERERVGEMRKVAALMEECGWGKLGWLVEQDGDADGEADADADADAEGGEEEEEEEEEGQNWYYLGESEEENGVAEAGGKRRDSG